METLSDRISVTKIEIQARVGYRSDCISIYRPAGGTHNAPLSDKNGRHYNFIKPGWTQSQSFLMNGEKRSSLKTPLSREEMKPIWCMRSNSRIMKACFYRFIKMLIEYDRRTRRLPVQGEGWFLLVRGVQV